MIKLTHEMELLTEIQDNSAQREIIELQSQRETDQWQRQLMAVDLARLTDDNALLQRRIEQL